MMILKACVQWNLVLRLKNFRRPAGIEPGPLAFVGHRLTQGAIGAPS